MQAPIARSRAVLGTGTPVWSARSKGCSSGGNSLSPTIKRKVAVCSLRIEGTSQPSVNGVVPIQLAEHLLLKSVAATFRA